MNAGAEGLEEGLGPAAWEGCSSRRTGRMRGGDTTAGAWLVGGEGRGGEPSHPVALPNDNSTDA